MPSDPYYHTPQWRALRQAALERDGHTCTVNGCHHPAKVVDHIRSRKAGGLDTLTNVRSLCREHDNQVKEFKGQRRNKSFKVKGCDASGRPLDPSHPWR